MAKNVVEILIRARDEASKELKKSADAMDALHKRTVVTAAALGAVGTGAVVGLTAAALAGARYADTIADISDRTGLATDTIATMGVALEKSGGSVHDTETAVRALSQAMNDAVAGGEDAAAAFERLGIPVADLTRNGGLVTIDELLPRIADGMQRMGDGAARSDVAVSLLGRSGLALVPVLKDGAAGFARTTEEARRMGLAIGDEATRKAGMLDDSMKGLRQSVTGLNVAIASGLAPTLSNLANGASASIQAVTRFANENKGATLSVGAFAGVVGTAGALSIGLVGLNKLLAAIKIGGGLSGLVASAGPLVRLAGAVGVVATALGVLYELYDKLKNPQKELKDASEEYARVLADEKSTVDDLVAAYGRLETEKNKSKKNPLRPDDNFAGINKAIGIKPEVEDSVVSESFMELQRAVRAKRLKLSVDTENAADQVRAKLSDLEIAIRGDTSPLVQQIAEARASLEGLRADAEEKGVKLATAESGGADASKVIELRQESAEAVQKYGAALAKVEELEAKKAESDRELAQTSRELANGLLELDAATGRMKMDEVLTRQKTAAEQALTVLEAARAKYESATVGTEEYARATESLKAALDNYNDADSRAQATQEIITNARAAEVQAANDLAEAYQALAQAQANLDVTTKAPDSESADAAIRVMEQQAALQRMTAAQGALDAGPMDPTAQLEALNELIAATDAYQQSTLGLKSAQEETSLTTQAAESVLGSLGNAAQGVFSAMIGGATSMVSVVKGLMASLLSSILSAIAKMLFLKAITGALTGGAALAAGPENFKGLVGAFTGAATGGEIVAGIRGRDTVPIMAGRGENILDHGTNDRLKRMLGAFESGGAGRNITVTVSAPMLAGGRAEAQRIARTVSDEIQRADLFGVSEASFA